MEAEFWLQLNSTILIAMCLSPGPTLHQARQTHNAPLLPNGLVLIAGGNNNPSGDWDIQTNFLSSAELFDPADQFHETNRQQDQCNLRCSSVSSSGPANLWLQAAERTKPSFILPRCLGPLRPGWIGGHAIPRTEALWTVLDDGTVLIAGGLDAAGTQLATAELYDYLTGAFTTTAGPMSTARQQHRMIQLYTGKVLVTGGKVNVTDNYALNSAELYDPATGTFSPTGNMLRYRRLHRSTELPNGKILITGGLGGDNPTANGLPTAAEIYDPATGVFTQTTHPLNVGRRSHYAFLLRTGKVLIAGGYGTSSALLNSAELYDPDTDTFTLTGTMAAARAPYLTMLPDGKVLVSNGSNASGTPLPSRGDLRSGDGAFYNRRQ